MSLDASDPTKSPYAAPALTKGLEVLELLAASRAALTMKEIAEGLGRSKNEIFRMLVALQERGYLARDAETDAFSLTDRLFRLGLGTPPARDLLSAAMPELTLVARLSGQSPHLVVLNHGLTVVTAAVPGGEDMSFTLKLGYGRLATDSTSGQVILAFQDEASRRRIVAECRARAAAPIDETALEDELRAIRARGHDLHPSRDFVGVTDICCPVIGPDGGAIAAIIIAYVNRHTRESRHAATLDILQDACGRIGERLSPYVRKAL